MMSNGTRGGTSFTANASNISMTGTTPYREAQETIETIDLANRSFIATRARTAGSLGGDR